MNIYDSNGYLDMTRILGDSADIIVILGARGTGKTYGALKYMLDTDSRFILMRRTQTQIDMVAKPEFSPFKAVDSSICTGSVSKNIGAFYRGEQNDKGLYQPAGAPIGYSVALSTISNIRGFDASDVKYLLYDEFIPERHERPIKHEGEAFLNGYETINRNRELQNKPALKAVLMSNTNSLDSPILSILGLTKIIEKMVKKKQALYISGDGKVKIIYTFKSPISEKKKESTIYRLVNQNSDFYRMAIENNFDSDSYANIVAVNLREYVPVVHIGDICIYQHKSNGCYFVSEHKSGAPERIENTTAGRTLFKRTYGHIYLAFLSSLVRFESYSAKSAFLSIFD